MRHPSIRKAMAAYDQAQDVIDLAIGQLLESTEAPRDTETVAVLDALGSVSHRFYEHVSDLVSIERSARGGK